MLPRCSSRRPLGQVWPGNFEKLQLRQPKSDGHFQDVYELNEHSVRSQGKEGFHLSGGNSSDDLGCQEPLNKNEGERRFLLQNKPVQLSSSVPMLKMRSVPANTCEGELLLK